MRQGLMALQNKNPLIHQQVIYNDNFYNNGTRGIQCDSEPPQSWEYGATIAQYLKQASTAKPTWTIEKISKTLCFYY